MITPVRDGMNLVAKEFVATRVSGDGVLILSEMAGASKELFEDSACQSFRQKRNGRCPQACHHNAFGRAKTTQCRNAKTPAALLCRVLG